jgi:hypothetical protein
MRRSSITLAQISLIPAYNEDGSVEIILSHTAPENAGEVNWLPIPEDGTWMVLRFYAPKPEVINLEYDIPGFVRIG